MKVLFQGDSVTDSGRDKEHPQDMGEGYPRYAAAMIQDSFPDTEFEFINLGISGNRTEDLVARLDRDFIDVQPDIVSIMIGINDVWHRVAIGRETTDEAFEANLRTILTAIREKTNARILLIQPFLLFGFCGNGIAEELKRKQAIMQRLSNEFADAYLAMDDTFHALSDDLTDYSEDGIHPNEDGAIFIAEEYLKAVTPLIEAAIADTEEPAAEEEA